MADFPTLERGTTNVTEAGLRSLPFCSPPKPLEDIVATEVARYMGIDEAFAAPSGFITNVLALPAWQESLQSKVDVLSPSWTVTAIIRCSLALSITKMPTQ